MKGKRRRKRGQACLFFSPSPLSFFSHHSLDPINFYSERGRQSGEEHSPAINEEALRVFLFSPVRFPLGGKEAENYLEIKEPLPISPLGREVVVGMVEGDLSIFNWWFPRREKREVFEYYVQRGRKELPFCPNLKHLPSIFLLLQLFSPTD